MNHRPPSPTPSNVSVASRSSMTSTTSTTASRSTAVTDKKKRDKVLSSSSTTQKVLLTAKEKAANLSRFDGASVEEAMEFVSRPHRSWDTALKEMAKIETRKARQMDDNRSDVSSVSCYSIRSTTSSVKSFASNASSNVSARSSGSSRRGHLSMLPASSFSQKTRSGPGSSPTPAPPPQLDLTGTSISTTTGTTTTTTGGGYVFSAPRAQRASSSTAHSTPKHSSAEVPPSPFAPTTKGGGGGLAGTPAGRSGIARQSHQHPASAPVTKAKAGRRAGGGLPSAEDQSGLTGLGTISGFVPKMGPRRR